jgi:hypothetical protein
MNTKRLILFSIITLLSTTLNAQFNFQRSWGTYFGDERFELEGSKIDSQGNLYIAGNVYGADLSNLATFTNSTSHQQNFGGGDYDGFIIKFNNLGQIVWGTFLGGDGFERVSDIDIDNNNNIYIIGATSSNSNIATTGAFQENLVGGGDYFISKFSSTGSVVWSTYFGGTGNEYNTVSRISYDGLNNFYIAGTIFSPNMATTGVFQETPNNSTSQISKFDLNGNRIWTTYYGLNIPLWNLKANISGVYVGSHTLDCPPNWSYNTYFGTNGSYKPLPENCREIFLTKFNVNGQREWSTYYGGNLSESVNMKNCLDLKNDKIYFSSTAQNYSNQEIATLNTYQPNCIGTNGINTSNFIAQFNNNGTRNWGTYNGIFTNSNAILGSNSHIQIDRNSDAFYNYGSTAMQSNVATSDGYLTTTNSLYSGDAFICKFTDQNTKSWGTYYGGELDEKDIDFHPYKNNGNNFYIVGSTQSLTQMATTNGLQQTKLIFDTVNYDQQSAYNIFIAHFEPNPLSNESFSDNSIIIYPNPANNFITIKNNETTSENFNYKIIDVTGRIVKNGSSKFNENIYIDSCSNGVYALQIETENGNKLIKKIIKN